MLVEEQGFFAATIEDEGIAPFQTRDDPPSRAFSAIR